MLLALMLLFVVVVVMCVWASGKNVISTLSNETETSRLRPHSDTIQTGDFFLTFFRFVIVHLSKRLQFSMLSDLPCHTDQTYTLNINYEMILIASLRPADYTTFLHYSSV